MRRESFYTKRFAFFVGRRCRTTTSQDVACEVYLAWRTVKDLEQHEHQYMQAQLRRAGRPASRAIGIGEIAIRKGHIVVSDLERPRPIWFGGRNRSEGSLNLFYQWLRAANSQRGRLAVMDMWRPFRNSTHRHSAQASILLDKFLVMRHPGEALDQVRKTE